MRYQGVATILSFALLPRATAQTHATVEVPSDTSSLFALLNSYHTAAIALAQTLSSGQDNTALDAYNNFLQHAISIHSGDGEASVLYELAAAITETFTSYNGSTFIVDTATDTTKQMLLATSSKAATSNSSSPVSPNEAHDPHNPKFAFTLGLLSLGLLL